MRWGLLLVLALVAAGCTSRPIEPRSAPPDVLRARMIDEQLRGRGIREPRVLDAMARVPRHEFVPDESRDRAYADGPLPIGYGQTISQPYIVAYMTEQLDPQPGNRVLEIGTGSGYQAAVLAELVAEVFSIELVDELASRARETLARLGYNNVHVRAGDGYQGWPEAAPFDRIILTAAPPALPQALVDQLAVGGILVAPVGPMLGAQTITIIRRTVEGVTTEETIPVQFVPMLRE